MAVHLSRPRLPSTNSCVECLRRGPLGEGRAREPAACRRGAGVPPREVPFVFVPALAPGLLPSNQKRGIRWPLRGPQGDQHRGHLGQRSPLRLHELGPTRCRCASSRISLLAEHSRKQARGYRVPFEGVLEGHLIVPCRVSAGTLQRAHLRRTRRRLPRNTTRRASHPRPGGA